MYRLTGDRGLGLLAAAVTALNPLLARHTVFVHQYTFDFLVTALLLLAAVDALRRHVACRSAAVAKVALAAGIAPLFSVPSVLVSLPIMHVGALGAIPRLAPQSFASARVLGATVAYDLAVLACYLLLRSRTNERVRGDFADGFIPLDSLSEAGSFLATNGQRLLEIGAVRGLAALHRAGMYLAACAPPVAGSGAGRRRLLRRVLLASALKVYPLGTGRPDIFAFPVSILLLASGAHLATAALPAVRLFRFAIAALVVTVVLVWPPPADYRGTPRNDHRLVEALAVNERPTMASS